MHHASAEADVAALVSPGFSASFFLDERLHRMSAHLYRQLLLRAMAVRYALSISGSELRVAVVRTCQ